MPLPRQIHCRTIRGSCVEIPPSSCYRCMTITPDLQPDWRRPTATGTLDVFHQHLPFYDFLSNNQNAIKNGIPGMNAPKSDGVGRRCKNRAPRLTNISSRRLSALTGSPCQKRRPSSMRCVARWLITFSHYSTAVTRMCQEALRLLRGLASAINYP